MTVIDGIVSGLDTTAIIRQLVALDRLPIERLQAKSTALDKKLAAWRDIESAFNTLRSASQKISLQASFSALSTASSAPDLAGATVATGAPLGDVRFRVHQLATANQIMSATSVGASGSLVGAGRVAIGSGLQALGATSISADTLAATGIFDVEVAAAAGNQVTVSIGATSVTVDRNVASVNVGGVTIGVGSGGLVEGRGKVQTVATTATSTVASLAGAFQVAGSLASAQLVTVGPATAPEKRLVFTSQTTGAAGAILVGQGGLLGPIANALSSFSTLTAAQDARIEIGTSGLMVDRSSNSISDVFEGVTLQLQRADPTKEVAVSVKRDTDAIATSVKDWVTAMNGALAAIDSKSAYDAATKTGGPLLGDASARQARETLISLASAIDGGGTLNSLTQVGISVDAKGRFTLNEATLKAELAKDPAAVSALFARSGSSSTGLSEFVSASDQTRQGTYAIAITQASAPAQAIGAAFSTLDADETIDVKLGSTTASITLRAGDTVDDAVASLNAGFLGNNIGIIAENSGGALRIRSIAHGSATQISVRSSRAGVANSTGFGAAGAGVWTDYSGVDVAGTIDGVAASGAGQILTATSGNATGLRVRSLADAPGALGSLTYSAGRAGRLLEALGAQGSVAQPISSAQDNLGALKQSYQSDITRYEERVSKAEQRYRRQFSQLETLLGQLKAQGSRLQAALNTLPSSNGTSK